MRVDVVGLEGGREDVWVRHGEWWCGALVFLVGYGWQDVGCYYYYSSVRIREVVSVYFYVCLFYIYGE